MNAKEAAAQSLIKAGWSADRRVAAGQATDALHRAGFRMWPELLAFLREYQGLNFDFERKGFHDTAWIDPERAASGTQVPTIRGYEARVGARMAPIGYAYRDHLLLLLADDGRFFGGYDDHLTELGTSIAELLEGLIAETGRRVETS